MGRRRDSWTAHTNHGQGIVQITRPLVLSAKPKRKEKKASYANSTADQSMG